MAITIETLVKRELYLPLLGKLPYPCLLQRYSTAEIGCLGILCADCLFRRENYLKLRKQNTKEN